MKAVIGLICVVAFAATGWGATAKEQFDEEVSAYKLAGEPIEPADFGPRGIKDEVNAAVELSAAGKSINVSTAEWKTYDKIDDFTPPLPNATADAIRAVVRSNQQAFAHVDAAMTRPEVDWKLPMQSPVIDVLLRDLSPCRELINLLADRALIEHQDGDDAAALADIERVLFVSDAIARMPTLVAHLVHLGMANLAADRLEKITPDLRIGDAPPAASGKAVAAMISHLLNDQPTRDGQQLALMSERMMEIDCTRCAVNHTIDVNALSSHPVATGKIDPETAWGDGLIMIRRMNAVASALKKSPDWQTFKQKQPPLPPEINGKERAKHVVLSVFLPSLESATRRDFQMMTERRMCAVALAVRWYVVDHNNQRPKSLADLVPKYLPTIPADPMALNQPLKYEASDKRWIVYSTGEDGVDDAGADKAGPKKATTHPIRWEAFDAVMHLDRQPRE